MELTEEQKASWDESYQPLIVSILVICFVLSTGTTASRIYASIRRHQKLEVDDYFMICATLLSAAVIAAMLAAVSKGLGLHLYRVMANDPEPPHSLVQIMQIIWAYAVLNGFCFSTIKLAILFFLRRLFWVTRWFKIAWWANVVYVVLWTIGSTLFYILQCAPIEYYWDKIYQSLGMTPPAAADANGYCVKAYGIIGTPIILNTIGDLFVLILPLPILFKLQTTTAKRLRLLTLFFIGFMATVAGFVRFAFLFLSNPRSDITYSTVEFLLWSNIEEALGIICANIPLIATLLEPTGTDRMSQAATYGGSSQGGQTRSSRRFTKASLNKYQEGSFEHLNDKSPDYVPMNDFHFGNISRAERGENSSFNGSPTMGIAVTTSITTQYDGAGRSQPI
ncbi:hypothetical protein M426DRAFT_11110 [Hypoxylon sp. CI-4A]|nr:hypothetical protein M426DRAFT_11110 [Hypoxylon sp. CI-4A]